MAELTNCTICFERFNRTERMPKILSCGHTFCKDCLKKQKNKANKLECSICRKLQEVSDPEALITNRAIYDLLYSPKIEESEICSESISSNDTSDKNEIKFKVIMIGPANSGKTSLVKRYIFKKFSEDYSVTVGFDFQAKSLKIGKYNINLQIWDTAGTELFQSLASSYYRNSFGAIVVFDVTDEKSFKSLNTWIDYYKENKDNQKKELIYLVGNKIDADNRVISSQKAKEYAKEKLLKNYLETSAKRGDNVDEMNCLN